MSKEYLSKEQIIVNIKTVCNGKKIIFLENDKWLHDNAEVFSTLLKECKIKFKVIDLVSEKPLESVKKCIDKADLIIYQTTWTYEISKILEKYCWSLQKPKIFIEIPIGDPSFYYKPKELIHDFYIFKHLPDFDDEFGPTEFYKITKKAYWEYENNFDK